MRKKTNILDNSYLFTVHNMCGEYTVSMPYSLERNLAYVVNRKEIDGEKERDTPSDKALPYLQEICDNATKNGWDLDILIDKLEKFGNPHYSPIPWEEEPLPDGAIE